MPYVTNFDVKGTKVDIQDAKATQNIQSINTKITQLEGEIANSLEVSYTEGTMTISFTEGAGE